jgi:hypothetical protein
LRRVVSYKFTYVLEVLAASIIRAMAHQTTRRNNPEENHLPEDHDLRGNLKSETKENVEGDVKEAIELKMRLA